MSSGWLSFRELDERAGRPKGEAFRAFRRLESGWREGEDYRLLRSADAEVASELIALREQERIYRSSVTVVLLSPTRSAELLSLLSGVADRPAEAAQSQQ